MPLFESEAWLKTQAGIVRKVGKRSPLDNPVDIAWFVLLTLPLDSDLSGG